MSHTISKKYVVVDTWVLERAFPPEAPFERNEIEVTSKAAELLSRIIRVCHRVVLDYNQEILGEYSRHIRGFVGQWLKLASRCPDKIQYRPRGQIRLNVRFDPSDYKFLEVAVNSPHKIVISGDSDFLNIRNDPEISAHGIRIMDLDEALREL